MAATMNLSMFICTMGILLAVNNIVIEFIKSKTELTKKYPTNIIAVVTSAIIGWFGNLLFYLLLGIPITIPNICCIILMGPTLFFASTLGYDKMKETILGLKKMLENQE